MKITQSIVLRNKEKIEKRESIIRQGLSQRNVEKLREEMDLPLNMAKRYFNRKCECGKELEVYEVGMFLRYCGRYNNVENDDRDYLCKVCFCDRMDLKHSEYWEKIYENMEGGCNLF